MPHPSAALSRKGGKARTQTSRKEHPSPALNWVPQVSPLRPGKPRTSHSPPVRVRHLSRLDWLRFRNHFATPRVRRNPPNGMHPSVTISASQPPFVLAPVGEYPPSTVTSNNPAKMPDPRIDAPHCSSWRVPSSRSIGANVFGSCGPAGIAVLTLARCAASRRL